MLTKFMGSNYKAFENFSLDLKPLTILLGANSCGKSAILNSFLMLSQSIETSSRTETPFRLNGNRVGMGESLNIIKDKNKNKTLSFTFEFDEQTSIKRSIDLAKRECLEVHFDCTRYIYQTLRRDKVLISTIGPLLNELDNLYYSNESFNAAQLAKISKKLCSFIRVYRSHKDKIVTKSKTPLSKAFHDFVENVSYQKIQDCMVGLIPISLVKLAAQKIQLDFKYKKKEDYFYISQVQLINRGGEKIIDIKIDASEDITLNSDVIANDILRKSKNDIKNLLDFKSLIICDSNEAVRVSAAGYFSKTNNPFAIHFSRIISSSFKELKNAFSGVRINHVSPLRAFPQRYYLLDKAIYHNQLNALDGTELAEVLKNNQNITDNINDLLAEFNIAIEIDKVNDIIHKISVNQEAVNLELTDVGFGISQVLPILVQAYLSPANSITIIEQPEIHLHPKMQAWLTDALIKIALSSSKKFIIETHSDALVRRLRLRIVDEESSLSENDVAVYYLERNKIDYRTEMKRIEVTPDGDISWPSEFMDVEINDTLLIQQKKLDRMMKKNEGI
ncbi:AAA family ATPase [Enterobacteriaceae bacterium H11S18]|uniref:AAA family ATPase n=1 Tax=Dryocola clanedunensis TaxID=2925396 RepID=UPI0022F09B9C|nr:AAA family ATPase [Dryocola clanedunensis]MCT4709575.1 AAA family ATPase [Dryocola clanedunensis]